MMAMIATTIISSMRVKPCSRLDIGFSVTTRIAGDRRGRRFPFSSF
jgi:hypothetical protein